VITNENIYAHNVIESTEKVKVTVWPCVAHAQT